MSEITELLAQMSDDSSRPTSELMARVSDELQRLAAAYMRSERGDHALQMRCIFVDHASPHLCGRRGGPQQKLSLYEACISPWTHAADLVALDEVSTRTVNRDWFVARAWLRGEIAGRQ